MKKRLQISVSLICVLMLIFSSAVTSNAAGSKDYNYEGSYRTYTEWANNQTAGIDRMQIIYVFAFSGETLNFGSSVNNSKLDIKGTNVSSKATGNDIVVITPNGDTVPYDVDASGSGVGYIDTYTKEQNGPNIGDRTAGYTPLTFTAEQSGVYEFHFHSVAHTVLASTANPVPALATDNTFTTTQNNGTVAAWDVTVSTGNNDIKAGRAFASYLSLNIGKNGYKATNDMYVVTSDGYKYKVDFNGIDPWGYIFFSNNRGLCTTGANSTSVYHSAGSGLNDLSSLQSDGMIDFKKPGTTNTKTDKSFLLFFEEPSPELEGVVYASPERPSEVKNLTFHGTVDEKTTYMGDGGYFTFNIDGGSSVTLTLDFCSYFDEGIIEHGDPRYTVTLTDTVVKGENTFHWDGKFDDGTDVPTGIYDMAKVTVEAQAKSGEIHFPLLDVEAMDGIKIERLTDSNVGDRYAVYYNNQPLATNQINTTHKVVDTKETIDGFKKYALADGTYTMGTYTNHTGAGLLEPNQALGIDSSMNNNVCKLIYLASSGLTSGGNMAAIDMWTYYSGEVVKQNLETEIDIVKPDTNSGNITGVVFFDADGDGGNYLAFNGDYALNNIKVELLDEADNVVATTTTDNKGTYYFYNQKYGNYTIRTGVNTKIYQLTTGNAPQAIALSSPNGNATDIGYYYDATANDIIIQKKWKNNIATEKDVTMKLFAVESDSTIIDMDLSLKLSADTNWRGIFENLPGTIEGKSVNYYFEEYYTYENQLFYIATSQIIGDPNNIFSNGKQPRSGNINYSATFEWAKLSSSQYLVTVTNTSPNDYKVTFHVNSPDTSITGADDIFKQYAVDDTSIYAAEAKGNYLNSDKTINEFSDIPTPSTVIHNNNTYIFAGWYYYDGTPLKWNSDKYLTYSDIYAHWIKINNVNKDSADTKVYPANVLGGFDLCGLQIRTAEKYIKPGLRFITSYSNSLINNLDALFTNGYTSSKKIYNHEKLKYGYAVAKASTVNKYISDNGIDENSFKLLLDTPIAKDVNCTNGLPLGDGVDHRFFTDYRISSMVIMYDEAGKTETEVAAAKASDILARAYTRYTDANGIFRTVYNDYTGTNTYGGCSTSFNYVNDIVKGDTDNNISNN